MENMTSITEISIETTAALVAEIGELYAEEQTARAARPALYTEAYDACVRLAGWRRVLSTLHAMAEGTRIMYSDVRLHIEERGLWAEYVELLAAACDRSADATAREVAIRQAQQLAHSTYSPYAYESGRAY